ncbi:ABC transporter [Klosneuvirus KNV1]|uniref:ABC transporter n=1 Tax=Klosneuvirus KNV1 TaxID=1977640 RepID=A0A1V0SJ29_9VIRU|nr:ABC transporter [Klosneuvirus KNV1]
MDTIFKYITNYKFYTIGAMILANIGMQVFKLETYRMLTEFINTITTLVKPDSILIMTFIKLFLVHVFQSVIKYLLEKIITLGVRDLFRNIIKCVMHNTMEFFKKDTQNKINQIWSYITNIETMMEKLLIELPSIITFMAYYIYIIYSIYPQAILFILPINLFVLLALHPFSRKQYKLQKEKLYLDLDVKNKLLEATSNIEFVKLNNRENHEISRIDNAFSRYTFNKIKDKWITNCIELLSYIFNDFLILVIYSVGIIYVLKNMFKPIDLIYLTINTGNFCYQIIQLKEIYNYYMKINPKVEIIYHMLSTDEKINNKNSQEQQTEQIDDNTGGIIYDNITFSYDGSINVIKNLSFEFKDNKINLLLGPNGSGKSTLIKLLLRLYEIDSKEGVNNIYFRNVNIKDLNIKELRKRIVFVSQEPHIFNETVLYNIKYGNENVPDNMIIDLCDILYSREWLLQNKNNLAGFRGRNLSGGERKKIQLINAICRNSDVIIFDEPTNTLDSNALQWFNEFIINLKDNHHKTIVIITHDIRLKTVSDHIVDLTQQN